ncbi:MAG: ABC transporter substrate-binding protein, partial [Spirochaetota bacterium]|nr:ABC transporter substrate-binding protein [Spirochaetota bacterium]
MVLIALAALPLFAGGAQEESGQAEGAKKTIVFWNGYTGPDRPAVEELVANFNRMHPDMEVKMEIMPWDSLWQKLMPALISGKGPDVMGFSVSRVPEFARAGRLEALDSYLQGSELGSSVLAPGLMSAANYNGKQYGVPMAFASMCMYYNKEHFREAGLDPENPPATMEELEAAWEKLLKKDASGNVVRYPQAWGMKATVPMIPVVLWNHGAGIVGPDGKGVLDSCEAVAALELLQKAFLDMSVSPLGLTGQEADNLFAAGKASIEWNGPWAINGFRGAGIDLGIAEVPSGPEGRITWAGDTVLVMNKDSKVKDVVWKFMEYWNSQESQIYWSKTVAFPPTRTDITDNPELSANADLVPFMKAADYGRIFLAGVEQTGRIENEVLTPLFEEIFYNRTDVQQAAEAANDKFNQILSE